MRSDEYLRFIPLKAILHSEDKKSLCNSYVGLTIVCPVKYRMGDCYLLSPPGNGSAVICRSLTKSNRILLILQLYAAGSGQETTAPGSGPSCTATTESLITWRRPKLASTRPRDSYSPLPTRKPKRPFIPSPITSSRGGFKHRSQQHRRGIDRKRQDIPPSLPPVSDLLDQPFDEEYPQAADRSLLDACLAIGIITGEDVERDSFIGYLDQQSPGVI